MPQNHFIPPTVLRTLAPPTSVVYVETLIPLETWENLPATMGIAGSHDIGDFVERTGEIKIFELKLRGDRRFFFS
jgi:hypothetical protein